MYKILLNKHSSTLAPFFERGEFAGKSLEFNEDLGGYVIEVDNHTAVELFNSSLSSVLTLIGPDLSIKNKFTNEQVSVIKGIVQPEKAIKYADDLDSKSVEELRDMAKDMGLKGLYTAHKDTIISKIRAELGTEE